MVTEKQCRGEKLSIPNVGDFSIEWHMGGDLKTLKCKYNISGGATSKASCLYCMAPPHTLDADQHQQNPQELKKMPIFVLFLAFLLHMYMYVLCRL